MWLQKLHSHCLMFPVLHRPYTLRAHQAAPEMMARTRTEVEGDLVGAPGLQNQCGARQSPRWVRFPCTSAKKFFPADPASNSL